MYRYDEFDAQVVAQRVSIKLHEQVLRHIGSEIKALKARLARQLCAVMLL